MSYMEAGDKDAPPLLLLHGLTANSMFWRHQYAALLSTHRVIGWNAPGYLMSDALKAEAPTAHQYAQALGAFLDVLAIEKAFIGASSFGSAVAQAFAIAFPDRVARLAFTGVVFNARPLSTQERTAFLETQAKEIARGPMSLASNVGALFGPRALATAPTLMQGIVVATNVAAYMQVTRCLASFSADTAPPEEIAAPLLLVHGVQDQVRPLESNAVALQRAKPEAKLVALNGIGHLPDIEDPARVNALMLSFFNGGLTSFEREAAS